MLRLGNHDELHPNWNVAVRESAFLSINVRRAAVHERDKRVQHNLEAKRRYRFTHWHLCACGARIPRIGRGHFCLREWSERS